MDLNEREKMFLNAAATGETTDLKPITRVERFLYKIAQNIGSGGGGGVSSWNDLTDKPFGEESVVYFEYTDGYEPLDKVVDDGDVEFHKVLAEPLTYEQLIGAVGYVNYNGNTITVDNNEENMRTEGTTIIAQETVFCCSDSFVYDENVTLTKGTWTLYRPNMYLMKFEKTTVKTIDPKYLPYANGNEVEY